MLCKWSKISKEEKDKYLSWVRLARTPGVSARTFFELINLFSSPSEALSNLNCMAKSGGRTKNLSIPSIAEIENEIAHCEKQNAYILCAFDDLYPKNLAAISDPPPVITVKGRKDILSEKKKIAIVGARNASLNGLKMAEQLSRDLSQKGYVIVSGLAKGVDATAHKNALRSMTIGVTAGGIDNIYPKENKMLFEHMYEHGLVLTEYKVGSGATPQNFPQRNRIISGLSAGVIVIEAAQRSGTLITARLALEQGRDVFAVPGSPFDVRCSGTNSLIKNGAILVQNVDDVINELERSSSGLLAFTEEDMKCQNKYFTSEKRNIPSNKDLASYRKQVLDLIPYNAIKIEDIIKYTSIDVVIVKFILLELELAGKIIRSYGNSVLRVDQHQD